jgi:D-alanine-D-alanine ligase
MKKMKHVLTIGVIFGGKSFEHEVSLVSARSIIKGLKNIGYRIKLFGIDKNGKWLVGKRVEELLKGRGVKELKIKNKKLKIDLAVLRAIEKVDVFFPVLHGVFGEDGTMQGFLEIIDKPYVGAGVLASACGMDKVIQKLIFKVNNLPVPEFISFYPSDILRRLEGNELTKKIEKKIGYPCFVKPANSGSSVGISKVKNKKELIKAIKIASQYDQKILVEKAIKNVREIEVSVLGNQKPIASLPGEIIPSREFYDYQAKYIDGLSKTIVPAKLSPNLVKKFQNLAISAYQAIGCQGMARVDFLMDQKTKKIYLSEINTIPGFTQISMYPKLWQASGISFVSLLKELIKFALESYREKKRLKTFYQVRSRWYIS